MPLQIMQNIYSASWFYLIGHYYVRSMFVQHHLQHSLFACLLLLLLFLFLLLLFIYLFFYYFFKWVQIRL